MSRIISKKLLSFVFFWGLVQYTNGQAMTSSINDEAFEETIEKSAWKLWTSKSFKPVTHIVKETQLLKNNMPVSEKISLPGSAGDKKLTGEALFNKCSKGVLVVGKCFGMSGDPNVAATSMATAFAITSDGVCVTNYHVLATLIESQPDSLQRDSLYYVSTIAGETYALDKILAYSKEADVAIFRLAIGKGQLDPIPLGSPGQVGSFVCVISHPYARYYYYYSQGVVARKISGKTAEDDKMDITADFAVGSSGAPILNQSGQVAGIVSSTLTLYAEEKKRQEPQMVLKRTIPVSAIKRLLNIE